MKYLKRFNESFIEDDPEPIDMPEDAYLYTEPSQIENAGMGLFTAVDINKGEIIATFHGEVLTDEEAEERVESGDDQYFMELPSGEILDCKFTDGFAKYANDAEGVPTNFKNNSYIGIDDDDNVVLIAKRNIKADEEIFTGYGKAYWKKHASGL